VRLIDTSDPECYPLPYPPRACVVSGRAEGEIVDFNVVIDSPEPTRLYIDRLIIEAAARDLFGMVSAGKAEQLEEWHEHEKARADDLQATLDAAAEFEERAGPAAINRKELAANAR